MLFFSKHTSKKEDSGLFLNLCEEDFYFVYHSYHYCNKAIGRNEKRRAKTFWSLLKIPISDYDVRFCFSLKQYSVRWNVLRKLSAVGLCILNSTSSKIVLLTVPRGYYFCGSFVFFVSCVLHAFASVYCCLVVTCWERLTSWLLLVMFIVFLLLSHLVSCVMCGNWVNRLLIFAVFLTLMQIYNIWLLEWWS